MSSDIMEAEMAKTAKIDVKDQDLLGALRSLFSAVLELEEIDAILVPVELPMKNRIMPTLVTDPEQMAAADPLAPAYPLNTAKIVSRLTRKPAGGKIAVVMRPCEIRAFFELVKLNQGHREGLFIIGMDCLGAFANTDYFRFVGPDSQGSTADFVRNALSGTDTASAHGELATACRACEHPLPEGADITVGLYGMDTSRQFLLQAETPEGETLLKDIDASPAQAPPERALAIDALVAQRTAFRDDMFQQTRAATDSLEKLTTYLADCVNCYNCRVACPVCYCRECVFVTDVFDHDPPQYLRWAQRKGAVKMPTDTIFFHLTRLAHMSTACVGCGQCSNACPNDIPVMELFRSVAHITQAGFDYRAGRSLEEKPPLSEFKVEEFEEVVGMH
ncbi:MAG: Coenzyme F420 hydrogenase/dehydrogenase, beta subunit C-terminal domain [Desulfobacterales bacterium]|nr:Coenzyme F420 hydrogenase/dehydrogenase, beta subunit C-terminal domain [Desulfobacterales bacterium]